MASMTDCAGQLSLRSAHSMVRHEVELPSQIAVRTHIRAKCFDCSRKSFDISLVLARTLLRAQSALLADLSSVRPPGNEYVGRITSPTFPFK